jgi:hypothetical protein
MQDELYRVESAVTATASGDLTWDRWPLDMAIALGLAGQRNPLGFAMVRYLNDPPSSMNVWELVLKLAKAMQDRGVPGDGVKEMAFQAFDYWQDSRCQSCGGRGVISADQRQCKTCNGTGQRQMPTSPDPVKVGIECLLEAERWLEGQLRARMKAA